MFRQTLLVVLLFSLPVHVWADRDAARRKARAEPPSDLTEAVRRAVEQARAGLKQADSWRRRLRWSALLPKVSGRLSRSDGWGEYLDLGADRPVKIDTNSHERWAWEVRLSWDLGRLVFDPRELQVARTTRQLVRYREKLIERIVRLYYQREKLRRLPSRDASHAKQIAEDLAEVTALLETLAGQVSR